MPENPGGQGDEPSPEDVFAGRSEWSGTPEPPLRAPEVNIYLTDVEEGKTALATRAVRAILTAISGEPAPAEEAWQHVKAFMDGDRPHLIGWLPNAALAREAAAVALEASSGSVDLGIGLLAADIAQIAHEHDHTKPEPADSEPDPGRPMKAEVPADPDAPADWAPSVVAAKLALNLLAQHDGVPQAAYTWARIMGENDPRGPWQDVRWLLLAAFPMSR